MQNRRTFLAGAGATVVAFAPGIRDASRQEDRVIKRGVYRTVEEKPLSESAIDAVQRDAIRAYRERFGSNEPVGVGQVKRVLEFPVYKFQYMIEPDGESQFWFAGPDAEESLQTTTTEVAAETTTAVANETTTAEEAETTAAETLTAAATTTGTVAEETTTAETPETTGMTVEGTGPDTDIANRVESVGGYMQDLQASADRSLPNEAELDLIGTDQVVETAAEPGPTTTELLIEAATDSRRALGSGTRQENIAVDHPVSRGIFTIETKAGTLHSVSKLGLDRPVGERTAHLIVQFVQLIPNRNRGWEIQSSETVHDWRNDRSDVVQQEHAPGGLVRGARRDVRVRLGISDSSASWPYSQPDVTLEDLSTAARPKWRWRWNRRDFGRNPVTLVVGSAVKRTEGAQKGDQVGIVRLGATFRKRGMAPVGQCERPWQRCVKPRFALESRYE